MSAPEHNEHTWVECPPGTIARVASEAPSVRRRAPFGTGVVVGITACLLFAAFSVFFSGGEPAPVGIQPAPVSMMSCAEVMQLLNEYAAGQLDAETSGDIERHLADCDSCRAQFESLRTAGLARPTHLATTFAAAEFRRSALIARLQH